MCTTWGGRGCRQLNGLRVAYLSGIHAPRFFEQPLKRPTLARHGEAGGLLPGARGGEGLGAAGRGPPAGARVAPRHRRSGRGTRGCPPGRPLPSYWIGNPITRRLVDTLRPRWMLCGHSHKGFAVSLGGEGHRPVSRIACLDQAARPDEAVFWLEYEGREAVRAGWGLSGEVAWRAGEPWNLLRLPAVESRGLLGSGRDGRGGALSSGRRGVSRSWRSVRRRARRDSGSKGFSSQGGWRRPGTRAPPR